MDGVEAGTDEPVMRGVKSKESQSRSSMRAEDDAIRPGGKGVSLSTVVAAYGRECERTTAQGEGKDAKAGSRGSSQTRTEACGNAMHEWKGD